MEKSCPLLLLLLHSTIPMTLSWSHGCQVPFFFFFCLSPPSLPVLLHSTIPMTLSWSPGCQVQIVVNVCLSRVEKIDRVRYDSGLIESIPLPGTRRIVYRFKLGKTRWTRPNSRDDSVNSVQNGENTKNNLNKKPKKQQNLKNKQ